MKPFFFSGGTYKYQKATQKSTKAFERFLRILLQFCRSRFRLIISEQKFRCKSQGTGYIKLCIIYRADVHRLVLYIIYKYIYVNFRVFVKPRPMKN